MKDLINTLEKKNMASGISLTNSEIKYIIKVIRS